MISQTSLSLSNKDAQQVQELEAKLQIIRDRVGSVAHRYHTACYLVGRPGTSKTYTVKEELERLDMPWVYQNARMTPMGLFGFLEDHPEHITVLDDIASLFQSDQAVQILLAALGGEPGKPRTVTYKSKDRDLKFQFYGGVIAISNIALRHDPLARALGSRLTMLEHEPTDDQIGAFMRVLALEGFADLSPKECIEVVEFVIAETREFDQRLDLRHLTKAWQDYRQVRHGKAQTPWRDLVRTSLHKLAVEPILPFSKREDIELQRQRVKELMEEYPNDTQRQLAESGLRKSTFYKRRKEVLPPEAA
jgi:hypothetical protein